MRRNIALFNPLACSGEGENNAHRLDTIINDQELEYKDITKVSDWGELFSQLSDEDALVICGGDGTLNCFVNAVQDIYSTNDIYYFPCGTGNDFINDIKKGDEIKPVKINDYIKDLPKVIVNGSTRYFINNVGFGIDGYCCQVGDEMRAQHKKYINYTSIAINGLLGKFSPVNASIEVDGSTEEYSSVWLAPTMKGRYYGGGMMPTPNQNRDEEDHAVSVMVFHCPNKIKTMNVFPSIFKGEHVRRTDMVDIKKGHHIKVVFDRPCPLQIDGETILNVKKYEVNA